MCNKIAVSMKHASLERKKKDFKMCLRYLGVNKKREGGKGKKKLH